MCNVRIVIVDRYMVIREHGCEGEYILAKRTAHTREGEPSD